VTVWTFAPDIVRIYVPRAAKPAASPEESAKAASNPPAKPTPRKKITNASGGSAKVPYASEGPAAAGSDTVRSEVSTVGTTLGGTTPAFPDRPSRPIFSVATETATLYSTNAAVGPVVSQLRKGEVVEPQFILNSAGQEWMFVSVANRRLSGFLRAESLGKKQTEQTSR